MLELSWSTFRERWQVFAGAILTVCLGVALFQACLLLVVAASSAPSAAPGSTYAEARALADARAASISLLGIELFLVTFISVFIVSSTFAFTVAQRRRDLALLRLTGATRRQVRSLLRGEALLLGGTGAALGAVVGLPVMHLQAAMLRRFTLVAPGFAPRWEPWVLAPSFAFGVVVACLGVAAASRRAARVRPLEALRDVGAAARVMTAGRWVTGVLLLGASAATVWGTASLGGDGALALSMLLCAVLVTALAVLSPVVVPLVAGLLRPVLVGPLGRLAHANLRDGVRRSASTAAPLMVLVAFAVGLTGVVGTIGDVGQAERARLHTADLIVSAADDDGAAAVIETTDGVQTVAREVLVPFSVGVDLAEGPPIVFEAADGSGVDVTTFLQTHRLAAVDGDLSALHGETVAVSRAYDSSQPWQVGDLLPVELPGIAGDDGEHKELRIVAILPDTVAGPHFLFPAELVTGRGLPQRYFVNVSDGADAGSVAAALTGALTAAAGGAPGTGTGPGTGTAQVSTVSDWLAGTGDLAVRTNGYVLQTLITLAGVYTVIAMVNAVVISASARRGEFATARLTGLTRRQVVGMALFESLAVIVVGLLLGGLAAAATIWGISSGIGDLTGLTVVHVPWALLGALAAGAAFVVGTTTALAARAGTAAAPIQQRGLG